MKIKVVVCEVMLIFPEHCWAPFGALDIDND